MLTPTTDIESWPTLAIRRDRYQNHSDDLRVLAVVCLAFLLVPVFIASLVANVLRVTGHAVLASWLTGFLILLVHGCVTVKFVIIVFEVWFSAHDYMQLANHLSVLPQSDPWYVRLEHSLPGAESELFGKYERRTLRRIHKVLLWSGHWRTFRGYIRRHIRTWRWAWHSGRWSSGSHINESDELELHLIESEGD
jgi:hypothetical protein